MNEIKKNTSFFNCLSGNILKLIAVISMTIDHIGVVFFPSSLIFRIIGRLAYPIFAFFIAEGCKYTKNRLYHLLHLLIPAILFQIVYSVMFNNKLISIFGTFTISVLLIYLYDLIKKCFGKSNNIVKVLLILLSSFIIINLYVINKLLKFDYGFVGIITPLVAYIFKNKYFKLLSLFICCLLLTLNLYLVNNLFMFKASIFNILAIAVLLFYNGKKGQYNLKYFFYIYYPFHLIIIYGIYYIYKFIIKGV